MFRLDPAQPPGAYKTYAIDRPTDIGDRAACEDVGCPAWRFGWVSRIDESTDLGRLQAAYIRTTSRRTHTELRDGMFTVFRFDSGQRCFTEHRTRPEVYTVRDGDWRRAFGPARIHVRPGDWVEDFGDHQHRLAEQIKRG